MHQSYYMYLGTVYHIFRDNGKRIKLIRFHNTVFNIFWIQHYSQINGSKVAVLKKL